MRALALSRGDTVTATGIFSIQLKAALLCRLNSMPAEQQEAQRNNGKHIQGEEESKTKSNHESGLSNPPDPHHEANSLFQCTPE